jgi:hypothetical protein
LSLRTTVCILLFNWNIHKWYFWHHGTMGLQIQKCMNNN